MAQSVIGLDARVGEDAHARPKRLRVIAAALAILLVPSAYMAWGSRDMPQLGQGHDDSIYWVTAKSLAEGGGYRIASLPGQPWQTKYPPLLPVILSAVWRISPRFPKNLPLAALFCWVWVPLWLAMAYRVLRDLGLNGRVALGLCAVLSLNQSVVLFGMTMHAEILFSFLWMASAALVMRGVDSARTAALAGIVAGAAYLTKTAGLPLILAGPLWLLSRRQYRGACAFAGGMLPAIAGWTIWMHGHLAHSADVVTLYYTDYTGYHLYNIGLRDLPWVLSKNLDAFLLSIGNLLLGSAEFVPIDTAAKTLVAALVLHAVGIVAIFGTVRHLRQIGLTPYHLFAAGYAVLLLVWHYPPNERFLLPLMPVLLAGLWSEIRAQARLLRASSRALPAVLAAGVALFAVVWGGLVWTHFHQWPGSLREARAGSRATYEWIARHTPADAQFVANDDALLYLYTGRYAFRRVVPTRFFYRGDRAAVTGIIRSLADFAREHHAQYLIATPRDWQGGLLPDGVAPEFDQVAARSAQMSVVFRSQDVKVYRFD